MPENYLDTTLQTGLNSNTLLSLKLDTEQRIANVFNPTVNTNNTIPDYSSQFAPLLPEDESIQSILSGKYDMYDIHQASISDNPKLRDAANSILNKKLSADPIAQGVGMNTYSEYSEWMDKYLSKDFGFRPERDNEDFYYENDYMADGWFARNAFYNPARFIARTTVPALLKLGEGFGYLGAMIGSIGSDNYWADVADNAFSKWLEGVEQEYKDQIVPIYRQAGFDEKGFFSKLFDWTFWNESVADGVAFMASAAIPGVGFSKLGALGKFGQAFSTASKVGRAASKVGLGSWAELSSWTFNTAMEASVEGAGVFKEVVRDLKERRDAGEPGFAHLTDEDIRERGGQMASNTIAQNFGVLAFSNAFENTLFFKSVREAKAKGLKLKENFSVESDNLTKLDKAGFWANTFNPLSRRAHYGGMAIKGTVMEGLWEENAQLAIERINTGHAGGRNFFQQLATQTKEAFAGRDHEASESIGLGALIGIGGGAVFSKAANERKNTIQAIKDSIAQVEVAKQNLFTTTDIWERDKDTGAVIYENNKPKVDAAKLAKKQEELVNTYKTIKLGTENEYFKSKPVEFETKRAFANYVRSLNNAGVTGVGERFDNLSPENARLFGLDPENIKTQSAEYKALANKFEAISTKVDNITIGKKPKDVKDVEYSAANKIRKANLYKFASENAILNDFVENDRLIQLQGINFARNLQSASLSEFPVEQLNTLLLKKQLNKEVMDSPEYQENASDLVKEYHTKRDKELDEEITRHKETYALAIQDSTQDAKGYYTALRDENGQKVPIKHHIEGSKAQKRIADYENTIHKNDFILELFSGDNWYDNLKKLEDTPSAKILDEATKIAQAAATGTNPDGSKKTTPMDNIQKKYRLKDGDNFSEIMKLVGKMVFGENQQYSDRELQLQQNYAPLIEEMLKEYEGALNNQKNVVLEKKLKFLKQNQEALGNLLRANRAELEESKTELQIIQEELQHAANQKKVHQRRLTKAIKSLQKKIDGLEEAIAAQQLRVGTLETEINIVTQEIEHGDFRGLRGAAQELRQERDYVVQKVAENRQLLKDLKSWLGHLIYLGTKLFGKGFRDNLKAAYDADSGIEFVSEINLTKDQKNEVEKALKDLIILEESLTNKYNGAKLEIEQAVKAVEEEFLKKYVDLTKQPVNETTVDVEDENIGKGLSYDTDIFPVGVNAINNEEEESIFDGADYIRPLHTKFTTTTIPNDEQEKPQDVQDFITFTENITTMSDKDIEEKLAKGELKALVVTKHNVKALGLEEVLADKAEYFAKEDAAETHFEIVPVIEEGGFIYFVDKDLNRVAKVGEKVPDTIIRRSLRLPKFSTRTLPDGTNEAQKYEQKYGVDKMKEAVDIAVDWRKKKLEETKAKPKATVTFAITRGIANKKKLEDGTYARNPVGQTLLDEKEIKGDTVQVFSEATQSINGEYMTMPIGRPFIFTTTGLHGSHRKTNNNGQFHYADNNKLSEEQVKTITAVFKAMLADHYEKINKIISAEDFPKHLKDKIEQAGGLQNLSAEDKKTLYLTLTKDKYRKGAKMFNANYAKYLSSVIYFGPPRDAKGNKVKPHKNQVYFHGANIRFGENLSIDLTNPAALDSKEVQEFLAEQFHNVKRFTNAKLVNGQHIEYYLDDKGELKTRYWKTYSHYLLAEKNPDGSIRSMIPVTTAIKTPEQYEAETAPLPSRTYNYRAITLNEEKVPVEKKQPAQAAQKQQGNASTQNGAKPKAKTTDQTPQGLALLLRQLTENEGTEETQEDAEETPVENDLEARLLGILSRQAKTAEAKASPKDEDGDNTPSAEDEDEDDSVDLSSVEPNVTQEDETDEDYEVVPDEEEDIHYNSGVNLIEVDEDEEEDDEPVNIGRRKFNRIALAGPFKTEADLDAVVADLARMLPQFPVNRLKELIRNSDGTVAWGQFVDNIIKLYEGAEEGTGYHEAFEAVANRLLTDAEWKAIQKEFNGRKGSFVERETGKTVKYAEATADQVKEEIAEEFRKFKLNKSQPKEKNIAFYLKMLLNFIKQLFTKRSDIVSLFNAIDKGKFATREVRSSDRFASNFRKLPELPVANKRDLFDGATASMFQNILMGPKSLTILDEMEYTDEELYEPIKQQFKEDVAYYKGLQKKSVKISNAIVIMEYALSDWARFVDAHKDSLKKYGIKFVPSESEFEADLETTEEQKNNKNQSEYTKDIFTLSAKKTASSSIRFLFGTLMKRQFTGTVSTVNGKKVADTEATENSVLLPSLVNQDEYMLKALDEFKDLNDFDKIEARLKQLAGIDVLELIKNPDAYKEAVELMTHEQAIWTSLYLRLFNDILNEEAAHKIRVRLHNYVSKQAPQPFTALFSNGVLTIVSSVDRPFYEEMQNKIQQALVSKGRSMYSYNSKTKTYVNTGLKPMSFPDFVSKGEALKFINTLGLGDVITAAVYNNMKTVDRIDLNKKLYRIREKLAGAEVPAVLFRHLDVHNYTKDLIDFINAKLRAKKLLSQYYNSDNQPQQIHVLPSFASRIISAINTAKTKQEVLERFPNLKQWFAQDSIMMRRLFDEKGNRTDVPIELGYIEALKNTDEQQADKVDKLELTDRYALQFQASLEGLYYTLPADSSTEWIFNFGEFIQYKENLLEEHGDNIIDEYFIPKLRSEINAVKFNNSSLLQLNRKHNSTDSRTIGESLRFFKDILKGIPYSNAGKKNEVSLLDEIYRRIDAGESAEKITTSKKVLDGIRAGVRNYLNEEVEESRKMLKANRLVGENGENFVMTGMNGKFVSNYSEYFSIHNGVVTMTPSQYRSLLQYQKINSILGEWETFKLVFGDPAQYKDFEKRAKSLLGPTEQTYFETSQRLNRWLNNNKNVAVAGDEKVELAADDWFYTEFGDHVTETTVADLEVVDVNTYNALKAIQATYAEDYASINEVDGQSLGTLGFARHLFIKSGWRWSDEHERYFQYDNALMRQELSSSKTPAHLRYNYNGNTALEALDKNIIEEYRNNPAKVTLSPVKTLMTYVDPETGEQKLVKHSVYFTSYQLAKDFELLEAYVDMLKKKDSLLNFESTKKVGLVAEDGKVLSYYSNPFQKNDLTGKGKELVDMRTIGIQVETQGEKGGQTLGSQLTKDINLNLFEEGVPTDFAEGDTHEQRKEAWEALSEEEKLETSANYRKVFGADGTVSTLQQLKVKSALDKLTELGVRWSVGPQGIEYNINDLSKIKEYIYDELQRLDIDENTLDGIQLTQDLKAFENPAEITPSYTTISNLLWSMADKSVNSMKVNGKPFIQVSSAFFNKSKGREGAYRDENGNWVKVTTKAQYDALDEETKKKVVMTSSELAFYTLSQDGKEIQAMEVYLPHIYRERVNAARKAKGLGELSEKKLMEYLNAHPELLEGVGFRIPTQDTASIEFFKIKGFLPEEFGEAVVVPSGITMKAGSDFDVDKLNSYLNNWTLDKEGMPVYETFKDEENSTEEERYIAYVRENERSLNKIVKTSEEYEGAQQVRQDNKELLGEEREKLKQHIFDQEANYAFGKEIFAELPLAVQEQYKDREKQLKAMGVTGTDKILDYLSYTDQWIASFDDNTTLEIAYTDRKGKESKMAVRAIQVVPVLERLVDNYNEVLESMGITKDLLAKYRELKTSKRAESESLLDFVRFEIAKQVAAAQQMQSFEEFVKLPMYLQNTRGAVENRYFQAIRNVLKSPEMLEMLLNPVSTNKHIKENMIAVKEARTGEKYVDEGKKEIKYTKFLSTEFIAEKRNQFAKGKSDIAIFAIAMTNYANSQITGLGISEIDTAGQLSMTDDFVFNLINEGNIDLPFEDVPVRFINGVKFIPISILKDKSGKYTMSKISAYISGAVDVAKDPYIIEMGMHSEMAGVYMLLERMGLTGKTASLFLYQPAIREYLRELLFMGNKTYFGKANYETKFKLIEGTLLNYFAGKRYDPDYKFTDADLTKMIRKGELINQAKLEGKDYEDFTPEERHAQYIALANFLKLKIYADHLLKTIMATNHDVSSIRSPHVLTKKELQLEDAKKVNFITQIKDGKVVNGAEAIIDTTSIKTDKTLLNLFDNVLSNINLFALRKENPKAAMKAIATRIFSQNPYLSNDEFIKVMKQYEVSLIDSIVNKVGISGVDAQGDEVYNELYKFGKSYFRIRVQGKDEKGNPMVNQNGTPKYVNNMNAIYHRFNRLKELSVSDDSYKKYRKFFTKNFFLRNLDFKIDKNLGVYLMDLKVKPTNDDILTKEQVTEALIELATVDTNTYPEIDQLYKSIVYGAYIQFGIRFSRDSFLNLLPVTLEENVGLMDLTKPALDNIERQDFTTLDEHVQRTAWNRKGVVQQKNQFSVSFLVPNEEGVYQLEKSRWRFGQSKPPSMVSQVFFGRYSKETKGMVPFIQPMFIWGGYAEGFSEEDARFPSWESQPDIISIKAVKPEYLYWHTNPNEPHKSGYRPVKAVYDMMQNGDWNTWSFTQLFKKVGVEQPQYARGVRTKTKQGEGILYLYKPIHKWGASNFNEHGLIQKVVDGSTVGTRSMLTYPMFEEKADAQIVNNIVDPKGAIELGVSLTEKRVKPQQISKAKPKFLDTTSTPIEVPENKTTTPPLPTTEEALAKFGYTRPEFDKLPGRSEKPTMFYAGIGSRQTPYAIQQKMNDIAQYLEKLGYTLRTGDAKGADKAFGTHVKKKEVYTAKDATARTETIAKEIHEAPQYLEGYTLQLMARNTNQVFGKNLDTPVDFVLAWTPNGETKAEDRKYYGKNDKRNTGGTGQAIALASLKGIPVINLANDNWRDELTTLLKEIGSRLKNPNGYPVVSVDNTKTGNC